MNQLYEELGRNYRFFAAWRHLTFAAGVGVWAGIFKVAFDRGEWSRDFRAACAAAAFVEVVLMMIDSRTREMINAAIAKGVGLETPHKGYFAAMHEAPPSWPSHTTSGRLFYVVSTVGFLLLALRPYANSGLSGIEAETIGEISTVLFVILWLAQLLPVRRQVIPHVPKVFDLQLTQPPLAIMWRLSIALAGLISVLGVLIGVVSLPGAPWVLNAVVASFAVVLVLWSIRNEAPKSGSADSTAG